MKMSGEIKCLGKTFASEEERREYFRNELRKKLPELKKIDGFPIGEDEDIIALSDPPYYTACPNPWLNHFIAEWENEKETTPGRKKNFKVDEPYASDVSEGKNNPIYNAHSYHTKVPHPAIMRYILHYTQPGDIIFDGFAGTGMTGVAAQLCSDPDYETRFTIEKEMKLQNGFSPKWGYRNAICSDLSPVASFIAANYNITIEPYEFEENAKRVIDSVEKQYGWMYETINIQNNKSRINYMVWSDVFICPNCNGEVIFYDVAVNPKEGTVKDEFNCNHCHSLLTKKLMERAWSTFFDSEIHETVKFHKTIPVLINYKMNRTLIDKKPTVDDYKLIDKITSMPLPAWVPTSRMMEGSEARRNDREGITHIHHFYTRRNLIYLSAIRKACSDNALLLLFNSQLVNLSKLNRYRLGVSFPYNPLSGTLYIGSQISESNVYIAYENKINKLKKAFSMIKRNQVISTQSATDCSLLNDASVDYIFTDPPFGSNISYSELNYIQESWLRITTNYLQEAIENKSHGKSLLNYQELMTSCFKEYYRVLKPGKWMTVEFSNTSAAVWNGIQIALQKAGFILANVSALDKQMGSFKAVTTATAVKQDLIISCYKPSGEFQIKFEQQSADAGIWSFILEHLQHLPVHMLREKKSTAIIERNPKILYDRLITYYLMRGLPIPIDAADFQTGLCQKFIEKDGMYFTAEQAAEYDELIGKYGGDSKQISFLFDIIYSENDAVLWLKDRLQKKAMKYQDIMPEFRKANVATRKGEREIELKTVLEENFIQESDGRWRVPDMNEAKDRETLRTKALLKEFDHYIVELSTSKTKKLKEVRIEALRAGFKSCWEKKDFHTIVTIGDKIPQNLLLEDEQLLMLYDIAKDRV